MAGYNLSFATSFSASPEVGSWKSRARVQWSGRSRKLHQDQVSSIRHRRSSLSATYAYYATGSSCRFHGSPALAVAGSADLTISPTHIAAARPDVVLLDVGAPGGLETLLVLRQALSDMKIVAIAVSDIEQEVVACAEAGVSGFVRAMARFKIW